MLGMTTYIGKKLTNEWLRESILLSEILSVIPFKESENRNHSKPTIADTGLAASQANTASSTSQKPTKLPLPNVAFITKSNNPILTQRLS